MKTLKELRMWHWREFLRYRADQRIAEDMKGMKTSAAYARKHANHHLGAVQILNDHVSGTAERDCAEDDALVKALENLRNHPV